MNSSYFPSIQSEIISRDTNNPYARLAKAISLINSVYSVSTFFALHFKISKNEIPLFRIIPPLIAGIVTGVYFPGQFWKILAASFVFILSACYLLEKAKVFSVYSSRWIFGVLMNLLFLISGMLLVYFHCEIEQTDHFSHSLNNAVYFKSYLVSQPDEKKGTYKTFLRVTQIKCSDGWQKANGKILCYFKKDESSATLNYGDEILFYAADVTILKEPLNPEEFNYKHYLNLHSVYHQVYLKSKNWHKTGAKKGSPVVDFAIRLRKYLLAIYEANTIRGEQFAVLSALILGYTDELDASLISAFSSAGAMHILSVSGLHVGIIFLVFNRVLFFLEKKRRTRMLKMILLLLFLWFYALITGLSPAVMRSSAMLSFVVIGQAINKRSSIYNTLCASILVLLIYDPFLIMEVGFQLSYLAVFGIVAIHPYIYPLYNSSSMLIDKIWALISVSVSAQITTLALGLFYFHQFPVYFIFSNLLVIPLSTLIIYAGILLLVVSPLKIISVYLGICLNYLVWLLNWIVKYVEQVPYALIQGISISFFEMIIINLILLFIILFFVRKETGMIFMALGFCLILAVTQSMEFIRQSHQKKMIVYAVSGNSVIEFVSGNSDVFVADSSFLTNKNSMRFHINNFVWKNGITRHETFSQSERKVHYFPDESLTGTSNYFDFCGRRVLFFGDQSFIPGSYSGKEMKTDVVILSGNCKLKIRDIQQCFRPTQIIIDGSNSEYKAKQWEVESKSLNIPCHFVMKDGAYIQEF